MVYGAMSQLEMDGKKCNASMMLLFHNEHNQLCVVLQRNEKFTPAQWSVSGGKVDVKDSDNDSSSLNHTNLDENAKTKVLKILSKKFDKLGLTSFAKGAIRETFEEIGFDVCNAILNQKATIHYFDRNDPKYNMVEGNKTYRTEFFYAYLGHCSEEAVKKQLKTNGCTDAMSTVIASVKDIQSHSKEDDQQVEYYFTSPSDQSKLKVRPTTDKMILFLKDKFVFQALLEKRSTISTITYQFKTHVNAAHEQAKHKKSIPPVKPNKSLKC